MSQMSSCFSLFRKGNITCFQSETHYAQYLYVEAYPGYTGRINEQLCHRYLVVPIVEIVPMIVQENQCGTV